jgi:hypothetical protein
LAVALAGVCSSLGWSEFFQRLYITGAYLIAIARPFYAFFIFSHLWISQSGKVLDYGT